MNSEPTHPPPSAIAPRLLVHLVGAVCRWPRLVLAMALFGCAVSVYGSCRYLEYHTQRSDLINPRKECQQRWRQYLKEFGDDDDIVIVVQDSDRRRMEQAIETLAAKVQAQPAFFDRLFYKVDLRSLHDRALLYLPADQIRLIQDNIRSMGLLLEFAPLSWRTLSLQSLLTEARLRVAQLTPGKPLSPADDQFLIQLLAIVRSATATLAVPADYRNPWGSLTPSKPEQKDLLAEPQYFFSGDGTLAFLLARPKKEEGSFTAAENSVNAMRRIVAETRAEFPGIEFGLTGLPVLETDEMVAAQRDTHLASWLAIAGVTLLFFAVYRGVWYPLLTMATLLIGTAWAMGWLTLTVGHLNILSATFAVMLIGMGDYGVLWVMRYEEARRRGADVRTALLHTTTHVAVGNLTAAATLAVAFFAAMFADFQAIAELGWIAGCGVLLCALACFTVLPALLTLFDRRGDRVAGHSWQLIAADGSARPTPIPPAHDAWLPRLTARPRWLIGAGLALTLLLAGAASRVQYDHNLLHMQARDLDSVRWEMTLIEHTAGASWHALSYTSTPEEALALKARYEKLPEVSMVIEVASLVPRDQEHKLEMLRDIRHRLRRLPERGKTIPHGKPDLATMRRDVDALIGQLSPAKQPPLLADIRASLQAFRAQMDEAREKAVVASRLQQFDEHLAADLAENLHKLHDVSTPRAITLADLPTNLRERYIGQSGKWLLSVFAKDCLWDFEPLEHFTQQIQTVDADATGKPFATVEGLTAMKSGFQRAGIYALLAIAAVLLLDFRNWRTTLIALAPLAMGLVFALGIMGLAGLPLNPANMIAFPLILGVGVDNGVHILHDYLLRRGQATISYPIGRGVLVKALTTMIGFGTLMISSQRGLAGLGFILTLGVGCCMVSALVFLPAVLRYWHDRQSAQSRTAATLRRRTA